jgi:5-methylthioadenosine/S-adenosylhomocysteine deaminase
LGLQDRTGSLTPGKAADLTAVSLEDPAMNGCEDPYDALVLCGSSASVTMTMVDGRILWDPRRIFGMPCAPYSARPEPSPD